MHNVYFLLTVYLKVYLINILLAKAATEHVLMSRESGPSGESVDVMTERRLIEGLQDLHHESGGLFGDQLLVPGAPKPHLFRSIHNDHL